MESEASRARGRSVAFFLIVLIAFTLPFIHLLGGAALLLGLLFAFGAVEILAVRFPGGVRLRWVFRPNLLVLGTTAGLFLLSVFALRNVAAMCIEGGTVLGFPWDFWSQCSPGAGGMLGVPVFLPVSLILDLVFWYVVATILGTLLRPKEPLLAVVA